MLFRRVNKQRLKHAYMSLSDIADTVRRAHPSLSPKSVYTRALYDYADQGGTPLKWPSSAVAWAQGSYKKEDNVSLRDVVIGLVVLEEGLDSRFDSKSMKMIDRIEKSADRLASRSQKKSSWQ